MKKKIITKQQILQIAFKVIAQKGWAAFTLAALAAETGATLAEIYVHIPSKPLLLPALSQFIEESMAKISPASAAEETPRDRLFDLLMQRFDILTPFKPGLQILAEEIKSDPLTAGFLFCLLARAMGGIIEKAGLRSADGLFPVNSVALTGLYICVIRTWLKDETSDQSKTMAALDSLLARAEKAANYLSSR